MKTLLILRHAKSSWSDYSLSDHDRPLKKRGKRDAPRIGEVIAAEDIVPDLIISSTARRAKDTAIAAAEACGYENEIHFTRDLYHAGVDDFVWILSGLDDGIRSAMVVAHNPGVEELLHYLTDESEWMPTAALAFVELPIQSWRQISEDVEGRLLQFCRPRDVY